MVEEEEGGNVAQPPQDQSLEEEYHLSPLPTNVTTVSDAISPRVSTAGTDDSAPRKGTSSSIVSGKDSTQQHYVAQDYSTPGLDSLHWAGVENRGDFDQRSIASSMNVEKDDKSVYEESGAGALEVIALEEEDEETNKGRDEREAGEKDDQQLVNSIVEDTNGLNEAVDDQFEQPAVVNQSSGLAEEGQQRVVVNMNVVGGMVSVSVQEATAIDAEMMSLRRQASSSIAIPPGSSACPSSDASPRSPHMVSPTSMWSAGGDNDRLGDGSGTQESRKYLAQGNEGTPDGSFSEVHLESKEMSREDENEAQVHSGGEIPENGDAKLASLEIRRDEPLASQPAVAENDEVQTELVEEGGNDASHAKPHESDILPQAPKVDMGKEWEETFKGLVYVDGIDALGRPVVVLDADAVPPRMKSSALTYVKTHLHPIVTTGDYVIVFTARKAKLPTFWIMGAYQTLPRPFRKNVQYIILVRPSGFLKAILKFMRPFVSKKAARKIKLVDSLGEIAESTGNEVTMHHLGQPFLDADAAAAQEQGI
eukprot:jgi/Picsp_1/3994/NSC_01506-R1_bcl2 adenovirus e1b 19kd interacting protein like